MPEIQRTRLLSTLEQNISPVIRYPEGKQDCRGMTRPSRR